MSGALITGAGSGIGLACAKKFGELGYGVLCADRDGAAAAAAARSIPDATHLEMDVTSEAETTAAVDAAVANFGDLRVAVACAGIHRPGTVVSMPREEFDQVMAVNTTGSFLTARCAARAMIEAGGGGAIVLIGSMNSVAISMPGQSAYAASKGAVLMLAKVMAVDLAQYDIRVNTVLPGITDTPLSHTTLADPDTRTRSLSKVPMGKPATPGDIAEAVAFLSSDAAGYVTGTAMPVDGGQLAYTSTYPWVS